MKFVLKLFGFLLAITLAAGAGFFVGRFYGFTDRVQTVDVYEYMDIKEPEDIFSGRAINVLLIGNDTREGENGEIGGRDTLHDGMRSDTTIILHISEDRKNLDLFSIPRDSIVTIPSCLRNDGSESRELIDTQFNWAFSQGDTLATSIACTISTIKENTDVDIDAYAVIDFKGFQDVINALGGVELDIKEELRSDKANLHLMPGLQTLNGEDALAFARARSFEIGPDTGSDLDRITRQQELLKAISEQVMTPELLVSPPKLLSVIESVFDSLTMSENVTDVNKLVGLAYELRDFESINFVTIPNELWEYDRNRVIWTAEAEPIWEFLKTDNRELLITKDVSDEATLDEETE